MKKNDFKKQTDINIIALDYLKIAGVNSLEELKKTIYWEYYQNETRGISVKHKSEDVVGGFAEDDNRDTRKLIICPNCNMELGYKEQGIYHLNENLAFSNNDKALKILCICGGKYISPKQ